MLTSVQFICRPDIFNGIMMNFHENGNQFMIQITLIVLLIKMLT